MKKKISLSSLLIACFSINYAPAQPGCTDPQALNFEVAATVNDGSCTYPATSYLPPLVAELPETLTEASEAEFFDGQLWVQQDGGVAPMLHTLDTLTGAVLQTLPLPSLQNVDWEDLAEDATHLYIGDFGNNAGSRTDLRIYKISKNDLLAGTATAEAIDFSFSDQTDFTPVFDNSKHDCEAFIVLGDSLHLFSKSWPDNLTRRYLLPKTPGTHVAELIDSLATGFLVTAADVASDGTVLLLGYDGTTSATGLWLLWDYPGTSVFGGNKRKISLGTALNMSQAEGLAFSSPTTGFICAERISILPQRLFRFEIGEWVSGVSGVGEEAALAPFSASPNPFDEVLTVDYQGIVEDGASLVLLGMGGQSLRSAPLRSGKNTLETAGLPGGSYFLLLKNDGKTKVEIVVK